MTIFIHVTSYYLSFVTNFLSSPQIRLNYRQIHGALHGAPETQGWGRIMDKNGNNILISEDEGYDAIVFDINKEDGTAFITEFYKGDQIRFEDLLSTGDNELGNLLAHMGSWNASGTVFTSRVGDNELSLTIDGEAVLLDITMHDSHQTIVLSDFAAQLQPMDNAATHALLQSIITTAC